MLYFDHSATSIEKADGVAEAMTRALALGNPGRSGYGAALSASELLLDARLALGSILGIPKPERIIFTSGATLSLNMAIQGLAFRLEKAQFLSSAYEHNAVARPLQYLQDRSLIEWDVVSGEGEAFIEALDSAMKQKKRDCLVLNHVSNVTGNRMPLEKIYKVCQENAVTLILDASQSFACEPLTMEFCDILCASAHKGLMGPMGIGFMAVKENSDLQPILFGGTGSRSESFLLPDAYPDQLESGTPNLPGVAGLFQAAKDLDSESLQLRKEALEEKRAYLYDGLKTFEKRLKVYGPKKGGSALSVDLPGQDLGEVAHQLWKKEQICVRIGLHCSPLAHQNLGTYPQGTMRLSLSYKTKEAEIDLVLKSLESFL